MKFLTVFLLMTNVAFAANLECSYQAFSGYKDGVGFDVDESEKVILMNEVEHVKEVAAVHTKGKYKLSLKVSAYENNQMLLSITLNKDKKNVIQASGLFSDSQKSLQLQALGQNDTTLNMYCNLK